jgi:predicted site-specific integrase-resolvase
MPITVNGTSYPTVQDAANYLGVSTKTVRGYISRGLIPPPPTFDYGARQVDTFPEDYLRDAQERLRRHRVERRRQKSK